MPYSYRGQEYELKPLTLGVKAVAYELSRKHSQLMRDYTHDVNVKKIERRKLEIDRLREKIRQKEELKEDTEPTKKLLTAALEAFENDTELQAEITYYLTQQQIALSETISDEELLKKVIPKLVNKPVELDFEHPETETFVMSVIQDFFFLTKPQTKQ